VEKLWISATFEFPENPKKLCQIQKFNRRIHRQLRVNPKIPKIQYVIMEVDGKSLKAIWSKDFGREVL